MAAVVSGDPAIASPVHSLPPQPTRLGAIERDLAALWKRLHQTIGDQSDTGARPPVTRACMSNLMIYCATPEQSERIAREIPVIVQTHPARVLLLAGMCEDRTEALEVFICLHYRRLDDGWQVSAEQVTVNADAKGTRRLPFVARSLLIGDLPTTLWWASRQPPPLAGDVFFDLAEMADQIIYDSTGWANPFKGVVAMTRWVNAEQAEHVIYNLAWRRLKPWCRLLCQVLDPASLPGVLERTTRLTMEHGPHALPMAWLLLGWFASRLHWRPRGGKALSGTEMVWRFDGDGVGRQVRIHRLGEGRPTVYRLSLEWHSDDGPRRVTFGRLDDNRLGVIEDASDIPPRFISAPMPDRPSLVAAQMAHRHRDKVFEQSIEVANTMASVLME